MTYNTDNSIYIIAEAGVNHNGEPNLAFELIDVASGSGADAVKFQTFNSEMLVTKQAAKADYQKVNTKCNENQLSMLKKLELPVSIWFELRDYCNKKNIEFLSTAFDYESLRFLVNEINIDKLKIPSGEITNGPFLLAHAKTGLNIILSTGMSTLEEVREALAVLAYGYLEPRQDGNLSKNLFNEAFISEEGHNMLKEKVTLLHCTSEYPAPYEEINLKAMNTMMEEFCLNVGYSDHSEGVLVPSIATAMGATLIEKHFTLDKTMSGPDHKASLNPDFSS